MEDAVDATATPDLERPVTRPRRRRIPADKLPKPPAQESFLVTLKRWHEDRAAWIRFNGDTEALCRYCSKAHLIQYQLPGGGCFIPAPPAPPTPEPEPKEPRLPRPERTAKRRARPVGSKSTKDRPRYVPKQYSIRLPRGPF